MRSKFEVDLSKKLKNCFYEPFKVPYTWEAKYIPDFVPKDNSNILIEAKGRFRTRSEARKYQAVQKSNPEIEVVFVFMSPNVPMPGATRRKDTTKLSHGEWAESNGFRHYTLKNLPPEWCDKKITVEDLEDDRTDTTGSRPPARRTKRSKRSK